MVFGSAPHGGKLFTLHFHASPTNKSQFLACPLLTSPWLCTQVTVVGEHTHDADGCYLYNFTMTLNTSTLDTEYFRLTLDSDGTTLSGDWDITPDFTSSDKTRVVLKKNSSPEIMSFYPRPTRSHSHSHSQSSLPSPHHRSPYESHASVPNGAEPAYRAGSPPPPVPATFASIMNAYPAPPKAAPAHENGNSRRNGHPSYSPPADR